MTEPKSTGMKVTRRTALAALAAGSGAVGGCQRWTPPEKDVSSRALVKPYVPGAENFFTHEERWFNSTCAQCPAGCGIRVRTVEGRAVGIEGNHLNPVNRGGIGARGLSGLQALYDADRIPGPLKRVGEGLVPISWEEALEQLARALTALRGQAPERLLVMSGRERGFTHELFARLCRTFGSPNFVDGSSAHSGALIRAMGVCLGAQEAPAVSWDGADILLSLEAGLLEDSCRSVYAARAAATLRRDRARRVRLIHAGPAYDLAAYNADKWLRLRPGTSGALALGLCQVLLSEGTYDREFVQASQGFDEFRKLTADFTPRKVEEITGIAASEVTPLARQLWALRPAMVVVDERSLSFTNGFETAAVSLALNGLLGSVERSECGIRLAPAVPLLEWPESQLDEVAQRGVATPSLDGSGARFSGVGSVLDTLPEGMTKKPPAVALLYHTNPVYARPQPARWMKALSAVPLVVSFSPFRDETVESVAHLVLPDHTYLERIEEAIPAPGVPRAVVGVRRPVITPLLDTRPSGDVVIDLARRLGGSVGQAFPWRNYREAMEERLAGLQVAKRGTIVAEKPSAFLEKLFDTGFWAEAEDAPLRKVEFNFLASWSPPEWAGRSTEYPLALLAYRPLGYAEGSGANQPWLRTLHPRPGLENWTLAVSIHPGDLPHGVVAGDLVRLESPFGRIDLPVHVDEWLERGCVAVPTGGGHTAFGRWAKGFGANVMELLSPVPAPHSGASVLAATRVRIVPAEEG